MCCAVCTVTTHYTIMRIKIVLNNQASQDWYADSQVLSTSSITNNQEHLVISVTPQIHILFSIFSFQLKYKFHLGDTCCIIMFKQLLCLNFWFFMWTSLQKLIQFLKLYNDAITAHQITDNLKITKQEPHSSANYESYLIHAALK